MENRLQNYLWYALYQDGGSIFEIDLETGREHSFEEIEQDKIKEFGLFEHKQKIKLYYDWSGTFWINDLPVVFQLLDAEGKQLACQNNLDPITYKEACAEFQYKRSEVNLGKYKIAYKKDGIQKYFFGYKTKASKEVGFQPLFVIDMNGSLSFAIKISGKFQGYLKMTVDRGNEKLSGLIDTVQDGSSVLEIHPFSG